MTIKKLKSLKKGNRVILTQKMRNWYSKNACETCSVGGTFLSETQEQDYLVHKLLGLNIPYKAIYLDYGADVGDGPGAYVEIEVAGLKDRMYLSRRDLE
jgi:hypothetical protein